MKKLFLQACLLMTTAAIHAQVGIGTATPDASAQLEISASNKGVLIPRMTEANRPASPATGLLIYQTNNTPGYYYYDGSTWKMLGGGAWNLDGNAGTTASHFIGTNDAMPLVFKVNGAKAGFIDINSTNARTFMGYEAGYLNSSGTYNTAFGFRAMANNTSASNNTAFGTIALYQNQTGSGNVAIGSAALYKNTDENNTAVGYRAMIENISGGYNVAVGSLALANNTIGIANVAVGESALVSNQGGDQNTGLGQAVLINNTEGNFNTAVGRSALFDNVTGSFNTAVGYEANVTSGSLNNTTAIGYNAKVTADNMVRIGNNAVTVIGGAVGWSVLSDIRFKKDIAQDIHGLDFVLQLKPITYHIDVDKLNRFTGVPQKAAAQATIQQDAILYSGFSAQQVEEAALATGYQFSGVHRPQNGQDHYSLDYASFVVPLVKAVQEQQDMINELKKQNELLQQQINTLKQAHRQ